MLDITALVLIAAVLMVALCVAMLVLLRLAKRTEKKAREDQKATTESGALPPSLYPRVNLDTCIGTGACATVCPEKDVIAVLDGKAAIVNPTSCIGHGECMRACPVDAITLVIGTAKRGVDIPLVGADFQTNVPGLYIVGELGGMGLIYNAMTQASQCMAGVVKDRGPRVDGAHELVIVGAGPAGIAASLAALQAKMDFVTLDQESAGGTVLQYPRHKIVMTRPVALPLYGKLHVTEVRKEALLEKWHDIRKRTGLEVRECVRVDGVKKSEDGLFDIATSTGPLRARRVILAMGRRGTPRKLGVPGEDLPKVCYRLLEPESYAGKRVMVVGGGDSAVEAGVALGEAGATAIISYRGDSFGRIKKKNQVRLDQALAARTLEVIFKSNAKEIRPDSILLEHEGAKRDVPNDYVLVFAGGILPTKFLEAAGVKVQVFKGEEFAPANA